MKKKQIYFLILFIPFLFGSCISRNEKIQSTDIDIDKPTVIVILLSKPITLEKEKFISLYHQEWQSNLLLKTPRLSKKGIQVCFPSNGTHSAMILNCPSKSFPEEIISAALQLSNITNPSEIERYKNYTAYVVVHHYGIKGVDKVRFINRLLHLFATMEESIGFINLSAQLCVRSRSDYLKLSKKADINTGTLFSLFTSIHTEKNKEIWTHTHGMEQFKLPDIECWYDNEKDGYYFALTIVTMALYMIDNGLVLKVGDTFPGKDEGVIFEIVEAKEVDKDVKWCKFGKYGVIRIIKKDKNNKDK